jgi:hypothetical protein
MVRRTASGLGRRTTSEGFFRRLSGRVLHSRGRGRGSRGLRWGVTGILSITPEVLIKVLLS